VSKELERKIEDIENNVQNTLVNYIFYIFDYGDLPILQPKLFEMNKNYEIDNVDFKNTRSPD
jgi:hypothetical protein